MVGRQARQVKGREQNKSQPTIGAVARLGTSDNAPAPIRDLKSDWYDDGA
jgi:hypothetical protein